MTASAPPATEGRAPAAATGVCAPRGFRAAAATAGLKDSGAPDVAVVVNDGPLAVGAGVFTRNRVQAAPVLWSRQVVAGGTLRAVVLNSGGANACTGAQGFAATHATAEAAMAALGVSASEVAVCSTGLIGLQLDTGRLLPAVARAADALSRDGGGAAAEAVRTTDTVAKQAVARGTDDQGRAFVVGGMGKGAAMLAPSLATMLAVLTTDAAADAATLDRVLRAATARTFDRVDADGCTSTNDTVLLLASGASGAEPDEAALAEAVRAVCDDLAGQMCADAEGASKLVRVQVVGAASEDDAVTVARAVARYDLLKCALAGADPNWGRVVAAAGTTDAAFDPAALDVTMNGVRVCAGCAPDADPASCDLSGRDVEIVLHLHAGDATATVRTTDLTVEYVRLNAEYTT